MILNNTFRPETPSNSFRAAVTSVINGKPLIVQLEWGENPQEFNSTERGNTLA